MLIIPEISLKNGLCFYTGSSEQPPATFFSTDPAIAAAYWLEQGAERLYLVDLDQSKGKPVNHAALEAIMEVVGQDIPVQIGGGIRDLNTIEKYLDDGVSAVVIGTAAVKSPGFLHDACCAFPGHIMVGLDAKAGKVTVDGWSKLTGHDIIDLAQKFENYGIEAIVYTDLALDEEKAKINVEATAALARAVHVPIIVGGGKISLEDLQQLATYEDDGIMGVVAGKSLYNGKVNFHAARALLADQ